jgi:hypothetical protein
MIDKDEMRNLYRAVMRVTPNGLRDDYEQVVLIVADDFKTAERAAAPTTGYYSFELTGLTRVNQVFVA